MPQARKLICILLGALMLMSALSGCAQEEDGGEERFAVRAAVCGPIDSLDPAMNTDADAESVFGAIYENLLRLRLDAEGEGVLEPGIAKEYTVVENYDGTVDYVFELRSSARWSDGTRVKAKDFVYAWRRLVSPATASPNSALLSMVKGYDAARETGDMTQLAVQAEGDTTFRVTLAYPCSYFLSDVCTAVPTMPLRSDAASKNANWATSGAALCNGPYRIGAWSKSEFIQLRRNESYYESRMVTPDALRFVFAQDGTAAWRAYEDGLVDYVADPPQVEGVAYLPLRSTGFVLYNHTSDAFSNEHVRRAFDLSLDRAAVAAAMGAAVTPATGFVPHGVVNVSPDGEGDFRTVGGDLIAVDEEGYALRRLEAESELRTGGYWGGTGFPELACLYVAEDGTRAAALAAVGIWRDRLHVPVMAEGVAREEFDRRVRDGEYDLAVDELRVDRGDAMDCLAPFAGADGDNILHYASKPYDLLIGVAESSHDPAARAAILHDAEALLLEETALSPLYFGGAAYYLDESLTGVRHDLCGNAYFDAATKK